MFAFVSLPENFWIGTVGTGVFGAIGTFFLLLGFKLFDWMLPKVDFQESMKNNPIATAIIVAAYFLGLSHIIASVVH